MRTLIDSLVAVDSMVLVALIARLWDSIKGLKP